MPTKTKRQKNARATETKRLKNKLVRVISNAGLAYSSWIALVELVDSIPGFDTAAWVYNDKTKQEHIWFSRRLVKTLTVNLLKLVLRHEMLHKSMYRGMHKVGNKELLNYALDCCINKILWLSQPKDMAKLGDVMFPKGTKARTSVMAIMNPAVTTEEHAEMEPRIQAIYDRVWWVAMQGSKGGQVVDTGKTCHDYWTDTGRFGNDYVPDALALYNAMAALLSPEDKKEIASMYSFLKGNEGQGGGKGDEQDDDQQGGGGGGSGADEDGDDQDDGDGSGDDDGDQEGGKKGKGKGKGKKRVRLHVRGGRFNLRARDKKTLKDEKDAAEAVLADIKKQGEKQSGSNASSGRGGGFSTLKNMQDYFTTYLYKPQSADTRNINDFIKQMETMKQVEGVAQSIYKNFRSRTAILPYPKCLTRIGFELVALGFNDEIPVYFNKIFSDTGSKKKICFYIDTSPSMDTFLSFVVWIVNFFDDCDEVEIAGGKYNGRYGFSGKVKGIPPKAWKAFKEGRVKGGCSTSFEAVVEHAIDRIEQDDVDAICVLTDGYSGLSETTIERFNATGKKCYPVYFAHEFGYEHARYGQDPDAKMESDLDKLNGDSYTIWCPQGEDPND